MISLSLVGPLRWNALRISLRTSARCCCSNTQSRFHLQTRPVHDPLGPNINRNFRYEQSLFFYRSYHRTLLCLVRRYSNLPDNENNKKTVEQESKKEVRRNSPQKFTIFQRVRYMVDVFITGCKALLRDVRLALRTRRKLGLYHAQDFSRLTREELRHLRQVHGSFIRMFQFHL